MTDAQRNELAAAARAAARRAYAPYSKFHVGAALLDDHGVIHTGCNVENVSYGLTICAERNAIGSAANAGVLPGGTPKIVAAVVYTPTDTPTSPCGACRQVLAEFNPEMEIWLTCDAVQAGPYTMQDLLPLAFDDAKLRK